MPQQQMRKKRSKLVQTDREAQLASVLQSFDGTVPPEQHSFLSPMPLPPEIREAYEEHRKKMGNYRPWVPPVIREEDEAVFRATMKLAKRDRKNPRKNVNLMPDKEIIEEKD